MADDTTRILLEACGGQRGAVDQLLPRVYDELKAIAQRQMRAERSDHTLQPTALVNEAFLKLVDQERVRWQGRAHFCAVAATVMRRILVDHARRRAADKRGGGVKNIVLEEALVPSHTTDVDLVALDDTLTELGRLNQRHARVVEMRFFAGLSVEETAEALGVSPSTVKNDWRAARAWLMTRMSDEGAA